MIDSKHTLSEYRAILEQEGVSLQSEGIADVALAPVAAQRAIAVLKSAQVGVVGGEVWKREGNRFIPTYDIWNVEKSDYASHEEYIQQSLKIADQQVCKYINSQDEVYLTLGI
jgi:Immunity protein 40